MFKFESRILMYLYAILFVLLLLMMVQMPYNWEIFLMGGILLRSSMNRRLLGLQFQNGSCFLYFKNHVIHVIVHEILQFRLGWLLVTDQGRYFIFEDALPRENMHELIWQLHQFTER